MSLNPELKSINCTACGAGLDILGGGRVTTHICSYCGTALDALDSYKVLVKFNLLDRPETPLRIGAAGQIFGIDFTVIGLLEHEEIWRGRSWKWVDHQVFSPTHGYAWVTFEDGHLTFSRRYRKPVGWLSEAMVNKAESRPRVRAGSEWFKYYDTTTSSVIYAEGEFTWAPRKGAKTTTVTAMSDTAMLGFSTTNREREIYHTVYLEPGQITGFGLPAGRRPGGVHALKRMKTGANAGFVMKTGLASMVLCLFLGMAMGLQNGKLAETRLQFSVAELPVNIAFEVTDPGRLTRIDLQGNGRNSWNYLAVELEDPEGEVLFESGRTVEYYSGRDKDGTWSEGSNSASLAFFPPIAGRYSVTLDLEESGFWAPNVNRSASQQRQMTQVGLQIRNGVSSGFWLVLLGLGFGCIGGLPLLRRYLHNKARWRDSDWVDEDDD